VDQSPSAKSSALPGNAILAVCAAILLAGYAAAIFRSGEEASPPAAIPAADPGNETVES